MMGASQEQAARGRPQLLSEVPCVARGIISRLALKEGRLAVRWAPVVECDASGELADVPDHAAELGAAVVEAVGDGRDRQFAVRYRAGDEL